MTRRPPPPGRALAQVGAPRPPPPRVDRAASHHPRRLRRAGHRAVHRHPQRVRVVHERPARRRRDRELRPRAGLDGRLGRRRGARHVRHRGSPRDRLRRDPAGHDRRPGRGRGPDLLDNPCVDFRSIVRAFLQNFQAGETVSGASTICQQLVRMRLFDADLMADPTARSSARSRRRSWPCASTTATPATEGKQRILEMYLNQVYYGNNAYGIWAAANAYFGKDLTSDAPEDQLTVSEAALLAGLVRAPSRLDPTTEAVQTEVDGGTVYVVPTTASRSSSATSCWTRCSSRVHHPGAVRRGGRRGDRPRAAAKQRVPGAALRVRRPARGGRAARGRGPARHRRPAHPHHARLRGLPGHRREVGRIGYDMDRLTDEELIEKYGEAALALDQAAPGPQHQQRRDRDGQLPHRRRARLRRQRELLRRGDAASTSRTSTSSARRTASPDRPSSRSPTRPASRPA